MSTQLINDEMTLSDVVKSYPQAIPYLNDLHLDYCCGGHDRISVTAKNKGLDLEKLLGNLNDLAAAEQTTNTDRAQDIERFEALSVSDMTTDLEQTHHVTERKMMNDVEQSLNKILIAHYPHHGKELTELHHDYALLKADLEEHFAKEERLVFPLIRGNEKSDEATIALVKSLEDEHTHAGDLIKKIQKETDNFTLPSDACNTYAYTFRNMKALFEDIFIHIFKENSVLFPEYYEKADPTLTKDPSDKFVLKDGSHATAFDTEEDYLDAQEDHAEELFHDHLVR